MNVLKDALRRLERRRDLLEDEIEDEIEDLQASAGYYIAQPTSYRDSRRSNGTERCHGSSCRSRAFAIQHTKIAWA